MKRFKNIGLLFSAMVILGLVGTFVNSCISESNDLKNGKSSKNFIDNFLKDMNAFMNYRIVEDDFNESRSVCLEDTTLKLPGTTTVFIDFVGDQKPCEPLDDSIKTPKDLLDLSIKYGAEFSLDDDGMRDDSVHISNESAEQSLMPLVADSKSYLRQRGLSDVEMNEIMSELNLDNSCFISLAMTIASIEEEKLAFNNPSLPDLNLFRLKAYAEDSAGRMAYNCVMKATGLNDVKALLGGVIAEKLTKEIAIRILRITIPKAFGYVGAAVMLVEFADCMYHYDNYF